METRSKYISYLLRHDQRVANLVDDYGFLCFEELKKICWQDKRWEITEDELLAIVNNPNAKKRFEYEFRPDPQDERTQTFYIRALNGHSFALKSNIFEPWWPSNDDGQDPSSPSSNNQSEYIYHVTNHKLVNSILQEGLKPMARQFVHLYQHKQDVKFDGKRDTLLEIGPIHNIPRDELEIFRSKNGYLMCPKVIPGRYIKKTDK